MSEEDFPVVVFNFGSYTCRVGLSDVEPSKVIPSLVARPPLRWPEAGMAFQLIFGYAAKDAVLSHRVTSPFDDGSNINWDDAESLWAHIFREQLGLEPQETPVVVAYPCNSSLKDRERIAEIMFESYGVPALFMENEAVLSLFACDKRTGVVLDCGHQQTTVVSVIDGIVVPESIKTMKYGGKQLDFYFMKLLIQSGHELSISTDMPIVTNMKERLGSAERSEEVEKEFSLPDSRSITVGEERFQFADTLFHCAGDQNPNTVQELVYESILSCPATCRDELLSNIICSGGTTQLQNFRSRLESELNHLLENAEKPEALYVSSAARYSAFQGASSIASTHKNSENMWITREQFEEEGKHIIHTPFVPPTSTQKSARN